MASKHVAHESNFEVLDTYFLLFNDSQGTCTPFVQSFFFKSTKGAKYTRHSQQPILSLPKKKKKEGTSSNLSKNKISKSTLHTLSRCHLSRVTQSSLLLSCQPSYISVTSSCHIAFIPCHFIWLNSIRQPVYEVTSRVSAMSTEPFKLTCSSIRF